MIIRYQNGRTVEGFLLSRHENTMRVALENGEDVVEFIDAQGNWLSESLESVEITFEWQRRIQAAESLNEEEFICSGGLAAHLVHLLGISSDEEEKPRLKHFTANQSIM